MFGTTSKIFCIYSTGFFKSTTRAVLHLKIVHDFILIHIFFKFKETRMLLFRKGKLWQYVDYGNLYCCRNLLFLFCKISSTNFVRN